MFLRAIMGALLVGFVLVPYSQPLAAPTTPAGSECRDLSQDKCEANNACFWKAEKNKCKKKEDKTEAPPDGASPDAPQQAPNNN
jgi:hypothetical protein